MVRILAITGIISEMYHLHYQAAPAYYKVNSGLRCAIVYHLHERSTTGFLTLV